MSDKTPAFVRTGAPLFTGPAITIAAKELFGWDLNATQSMVVAAIIGFVYYVLVRYLEEYNPKLGYLLGIAKKPAYSKEDAPSPGPGQDVEAVVVPEGEGAEVPSGEVVAPESDPEPLLAAPTPRVVALADVQSVAKKLPAKKAPAKKTVAKKTTPVKQVPVKRTTKRTPPEL